MPRGDSASRIFGTLKGRCEVQFLKNCYAPTVHMGTVINYCNYQAFAAAARVGTGNYL